jgi:hypothetical protein
VKRIIEALSTVLAVCVGIRIAAWLVIPLIPAIAVFLFLALVVFVILFGPRSGIKPFK